MLVFSAGIHSTNVTSKLLGFVKVPEFSKQTQTRLLTYFFQFYFSYSHNFLIHAAIPALFVDDAHRAMHGRVPDGAGGPVNVADGLVYRDGTGLGGTVHLQQRNPPVVPVADHCVRDAGGAGHHAPQVRELDRRSPAE